MVIRSRNERLRIHRSQTLVAVSGILLGASNAMAAPQDSESSKATPVELSSVVVTALRKPTDVQSTAVAVSVVDGDRLNAISDVFALTDLTAALDVSPSAGPYSNYTIRGVNNFAVNSFSDSAVAVNVDGVYMGRPTAQHGLFFDLERVEILKGPQGTLYGRNATGGAINIITRKPTFEFGGNANVELGDFSRYLANGAVNIPLGSATGLRFAGQYADRDGFYTDDTNDEKLRAGRVSFLTVPSDALSISLTGDYAHQGGRGGGSTALTSTGNFAFDPWMGFLDTPQVVRAGPPTNAAFPPPRDIYQDNDFWGVTGEVVFRTGPGSLTLIPGYRSTETDFLNAAVGFFVNEQSNAEQPSFEARFASSDERALRYLVGAYYFQEKIDSQAFFDQSAQGVSYQVSNLKTESYAGFGQLVWAATDTVRLTGGARYTQEDKTADTQSFSIQPRFVPPAPPPVFPGNLNFSNIGASNSYNATTWTGGAEWDVASRSLLYANVGRGFKAGGFFSGPTGGNTYSPETVTSYAIGSKNRFIDNRMQVNVELFYLDYKNQQIAHLDRRVLPGSTNAVVVQAVDNAGQATTQGADLEFEFLAFRNTTLLSQIQYLDATYDQLIFRTPQLGPVPPPYGCPFTAAGGFYTVNCSGKDATQSPELTAILGVEQRFPLGDGAVIAANLTSRYESDRETRINYLPQTLAPSYTRSSASVVYRSASREWSLQAFVDNIENDADISQGYVHSSFPTVNLTLAALKPPRTYGARFAYEF